MLCSRIYVILSIKGLLLRICYIHIHVDVPLCVDGAVYLVKDDLPSDSDGTIQICKNGEWGTVCDDFFGVEEAKIVCRQLGLTHG